MHGLAKNSRTRDNRHKMLVGAEFYFHCASGSSRVSSTSDIASTPGSPSLMERHRKILNLRPVCLCKAIKKWPAFF